MTDWRTHTEIVERITYWRDELERRVAALSNPRPDGWKADSTAACASEERAPMDLVIARIQRVRYAHQSLEHAYAALAKAVRGHVGQTRTTKAGGGNG